MTNYTRNEKSAMKKGSKKEKTKRLGANLNDGVIMIAWKAGDATWWPRTIRCVALRGAAWRYVVTALSEGRYKLRVVLMISSVRKILLLNVGIVNLMCPLVSLSVSLVELHALWHRNEKNTKRFCCCLLFEVRQEYVLPFFFPIKDSKWNSV